MQHGLKEVRDHKTLQLNKLEEIPNKAYDNAQIKKRKKTKETYDNMISRKNF